MKASETLPETISWESSRQITQELISRLNNPTDEAIEGLDAQNGVYVVTYDGSALGFGFGDSDPGEKVVYVGVSKFNSSRHFKDGNTGTSTLRRSLGALLASRLELFPVPRSMDENDVDRYNNYAFDQVSEERLTQWMADNFKLSFLQLEPQQTEPVYRGLINYNVPIFNFQHNPENKYGTQIKVARKQCAEEAMQHNA